MAPPVTIALIVAVAENSVIGANDDLPWRLSSDLKRFRALTMGKPLIMGRKTFQSLKKPLDGRDNIVVTRDPDFSSDGVHVERDIESALSRARSCAKERGVDEIMVIGGAEIYRSLLEYAGRIYLTRVHATPQGDTSFPELDENCWSETFIEQLPRGPRDEYPASLHIFERCKMGQRSQ